MSRARHDSGDDDTEGRGIKNKEPTEDVEIPPPPGVGPMPHYRRGGRSRGGRDCVSRGGRSHRRMDRPARARRQAGGASIPPAMMSAMTAPPRQPPMVPSAAPPGTIPIRTAAKGGRLSAAQRRAMPAGEFALPGHGEGPKGRGAGSYPIDTLGRARNALARGSRNASPSELATIKRKVHAKYPGIEIGGSKKD